MDELTKKELFKEIVWLKKHNKLMISQINDFRKLGVHTVDVDMRMLRTENLAKRANDEVFTLWKILRFKLNRAHPIMINSMLTIGREMSVHVRECGQAWKFTDSQHVRDENPDLFMERENIEGKIRDNLISLTLLSEIAHEYKSRYGTYKHLISDRGFSWVQIIAGFIVGIITSTTVLIISNMFGLKQ